MKCVRHTTLGEIRNARKSPIGRREWKRPTGISVLDERIYAFLYLTHIGTCRIRLSEGISKYQQLKMKSVTTALNTALASAHTQMPY
jgi:hypothetical protein